mgnify:CR=1 FL=1
MTKKLVWRLGKLPSPDEVRELVKDKIITQEEARKVLFSEQDEKEKSNEELESEIEFLRGLVDKLSENRVTEVTKYIEYIRPRYERWPWINPYVTWTIGVSSSTANGYMTNTVATGESGSSSTIALCSGTNFSSFN